MTRRGGPSARARAAHEPPPADGLRGSAPLTLAEEEAQLAAALAASLRLDGEPPAAEEARGSEAGPAREGAEPEPQPAPQGARAAGPPRTVAGGTVAPKRRAGGQRLRFYAVTRAPEEGAGHLGVHHSSWAAVAERLGLSARGLAGSGFHARGFDTLDDAVEYWSAEGWALPAPLF